MAMNSFVNIKDLPGESDNAKHTGWIEVLSFSHGIAQQSLGAAGTGGSRSSGRSDHQDFVITKEMDKATPKLNLFCCNGKHIPTVDVELCRATGEEECIMSYKMTDVLITSVSISGASGSNPMESVSFNYATMEWTYNVLDHKTGKPTGKVAAKWDVTTNKGA